MTHALKTVNPFYKSIVDGSKRFELRKDDRPFKVNDDILLQEYDNGAYTGNEERFIISYILRDVPQFGLKNGYCIIGLKKENSDEY